MPNYIVEWDRRVHCWAYVDADNEEAAIQEMNKDGWASFDEECVADDQDSVKVTYNGV